MKSYYRIMAGRQSMHSVECFKGSFIGAGFLKDINLMGKLVDDYRQFNKWFIPELQRRHPEKTKVASGLAGGMTHTICKGMKPGDVVLIPDGSGEYWVGDVVSDYEYVEGGVLPHRRRINWYSTTISRSDMSDALKNSSGSIGTVSNLTKYADEIELLLKGSGGVRVIATDESIEDPAVFALEKHLEDFLVKNWSHTLLGKEYDLYTVEGEMIGQQYPSDTGPIDLLAISKNSDTLLVVELKKGRASDVVVGQIQRYMGYVKDELAEDGQSVKGCIIALEDDLRLQRALSVTQGIDFYRYQIDFKLISDECVKGV